MKITKSQLERIIKEELEEALTWQRSLDNLAADLVGKIVLKNEYLGDKVEFPVPYLRTVNGNEYQFHIIGDKKTNGLGVKIARAFPHKRIKMSGVFRNGIFRVQLEDTEEATQVFKPKPNKPQRQRIKPDGKTQVFEPNKPQNLKPDEKTQVFEPNKSKPTSGSWSDKVRPATQVATDPIKTQIMTTDELENVRKRSAKKPSVSEARKVTKSNLQELIREELAKLK